MTKLLVDSSYRHEYTRLWAEQRRYVVSELLPDSAPADVRPPTGSGATGAQALVCRKTYIQTRRSSRSTAADHLLHFRV